MKSPRTLTTLVLGGLALLAMPMIAQSTGASGPAGATGPAGANSSVVPGHVDPVNPATPPYNPTASTSSPAGNPAAPATAGSGATTTGPNSASPANPYDPTSKNTPSSTTLDSRSTVNTDKAGTNPWVTQFQTLDADRDGRLSFSEFSASSVPGVAATNGSVARGTGNANASTSVATGTPGATTATASTPGTTSAMAASSDPSQPNSAQMFRQLDTNHDGYLSRAELEAYRARTDSVR